MTDRNLHKHGDPYVVSLCPCVCKTPMGKSTPPVPYPIVSSFANAQNTSPNVNFEGYPAFHENSHWPRVIGNEAGTAGGIKSGVNKGYVNANTKSSTVRVNGNYVIRHSDIMQMNAATPTPNNIA